MNDTVAPFHKKGKYTDIRVLVRDIMEKNPDCSEGILVLFDKDRGMRTDYVCSSSLLAFAGADLSHRSVTDGDS